MTATAKIYAGLLAVPLALAACKDDDRATGRPGLDEPSAVVESKAERPEEDDGAPARLKTAGQPRAEVVTPQTEHQIERARSMRADLDALEERWVILRDDLEKRPRRFNRDARAMERIRTQLDEAQRELRWLYQADGTVWPQQAANLEQEIDELEAELKQTRRRVEAAEGEKEG